MFLTNGGVRWPLCQPMLFVTGGTAFRAALTQSCAEPQTVLQAFHPPPHSCEAEADLHLLCSMRALAMYDQRLPTFRSTEQLFVYCSDAAKGLPLSKQSHWICVGVLAHTRQGLAPPLGVRAHSTRGVAASTALLSRRHLHGCISVFPRPLCSLLHVVPGAVVCYAHCVY